MARGMDPVELASVKLSLVKLFNAGFSATLNPLGVGLLTVSVSLLDVDCPVPEALESDEELDAWALIEAKLVMIE